VSARKSKPNPAPEPAADPQAERQRVAALFERAKRGDESALTGFLDALADPDTLTVYGDIAHYAKLTLLQQIAKDNEPTKLAVAIKMERIRISLVGRDPSPLEGLLADRVVMCWLHLHTLEMNWGTGEGLRPAEAARHQRSLSRAHTRYLAALKTLAIVQRLAVPVLEARLRDYRPATAAVGAD
jgi:hypothetical protein